MNSEDLALHESGTEASLPGAVRERADLAAGMPEKEAAGAIRDGRAADERWHVRGDGSRFWGQRGNDGDARGLR